MTTTTGRWWAAGAITALCFLAGCTAQVNNTALNMQESYKTLLMKQILYNLGEAERDGPGFFPSQIIVSGGAAESSNTIAPSFSLPLPGMTTVGGYSGQAFSGSTSVNWGAPGFSLGVSDTWRLNWGLTPRNDPDELTRLHALYRFATGNIEGGCPSEPRLAAKSLPDNSLPLDRAGYGASDDRADAWLKENYVIQGGKGSANPAFTQEPNCILCQEKPVVVPQSRLSVNRKLHCGFISTSPKDGFQPFERYGSSQFYVRAPNGRREFLQFTLFILEAMSNASYAAYKVEVPQPEPGVRSMAPMFMPGPQPPKSLPVTPFSLPL